ncbi:hypothetical protein FGG08_001108 [Glutinoglossum americanum]|uniref:Triacylglycerol lipase n=1 Tax=Glutinoglossum americanum TaxID=1670608 RepID=A0A9P8I2K4_9PEZI|nr:hypothetical protein FGG08_001108 [Glutinoglossum americanum]
MQGVLSLWVCTHLLLFGLTLAVPAIKERSVSPDLFWRLNLFEQYSAAAHCTNNIAGGGTPAPGTRVTCPPGNCPLVEAATTTMLTEFTDSGITGVTGFVAADATNNLVVVSFRGSVSANNWIIDFLVDLVDTGLCSGCKAHTGFWISWAAARNQVLNAITTGMNLYPGYQLVVTGHSLGAAIATLAAAELRNSGHTVALYNYGSPKVGNDALAVHVTNQPGGNFRVTHTDDPAPRFPLLNLYEHINPEYWITTGNNVAVTAADIQYLPNGGGDVGATLGLDFAAHGWYFNNIIACS